MYRIAKLAELLNVSTVQIHEKLILYKAELAPYTHKESGVTHISDSGLLILKHVFEEEQLATTQLPYEEADKSDSPEDSSGSLSEIDRRELELLNLKDRLNQNRSELHRLNMESRKLDEAITHYMSMLKEDFDKRIRQEDQLEGFMRLQKQSQGSVNPMNHAPGSSRK